MEHTLDQHMDFTYQRETEGFSVTVTPEFVPEHSDEDKSQFVYAYSVKIKNESAFPAKLVRRSWRIRMGVKQEKVVEGKGVVGQTPYLMPGEEFEYTSFCPLPTPFGSMRGHYLMEREDLSHFAIQVPLFFFRPPPHLQ